MCHMKADVAEAQVAANLFVDPFQFSISMEEEQHCVKMRTHRRMHISREPSISERE